MNDTRTTSSLTSLQDRVRTWRAERAEDRQLERALAEYRTASELNDLYAALNRHDDAATAKVRRILDGQVPSAA